MNLKDKLSEKIWVEKYRPKTLEDLCISTPYRKAFKTIIETKNIPNMTLYSSNPGCGKTSLARMLPELCNCSYKEINASENRGIDTLRTTIDDFVSSGSPNGNLKIVILEEIDGVFSVLENALKNYIEKVHARCRFICTCNNLNGISNYLKSRMPVYDFNYSNDADKKSMIPQILKRLEFIVNSENIKLDNKSTLKNLIDLRYPDIRYMIQDLYTINLEYGEINIDNIGKTTIDSKFYELILNCKFQAARKFAIDSGIVNKYIFQNLKENILDAGLVTIKSLYYDFFRILNDYDYKQDFVVDKELNFASCLIELMTAIKENTKED